jgi:hypothetical protein
VCSLLRRFDAVDRFVERIRGGIAPAVVAVIAITASVVAIAGAEAMRPLDHTDSLATRAVIAQTLPRLSHDQRYRLQGDGGLGYFVQYGLMRAMLDHGYHAFVPFADVQLGRVYASDNPRDSMMLVTSDIHPLPRGARQIAEYDRSTPAERAQLEHARTTAAAALRADPLRLTAHGEQQRRRATGLRRIALDAVANGAMTPDLLLDSTLDLDVFGSRLAPKAPSTLFEVGPQIVPTLFAYGNARRTISGALVRVALLPAA